ncbi:MAG: dienelactone hydrolase family protein, partial [Anaerolineae bacterium]|nr:dienelactone hydrolase family protein [Anaerolineae bacterium]
GCAPSELPAPTEAMPSPSARATSSLVTTATSSPLPTATTVPDAGIAAPAQPLQPVPGAQSPLSVPVGDPAVITDEVRFDRRGEPITAYLARPAAEGTYAAILVCHENRGLTPHIRDVARRLAKAGYVALAIDLLVREGGTDALDPDQIPALLSAAPAERHVADFAAGIDFLRSLDDVEDERIGMTGFCFGGGITWRCAVSLPELQAAVPFYGPAPDLAQVPNIEAAVFGVYAELDSRVNAGKDALEQALVDAGITHRIKVYPGVNHAFHNDTGQRYAEAQAMQAWQDTLDWFAEHV